MPLRARLLFLVIVAVPAWAQFRAGAAKAVITPDLEKHGPIYLAGFGQNRKATGIHDDLFARCLAISVLKRPVVLCGVDSIGLFNDDVAKIREGIDADVVVASLHDHEAPDTMGLWGPAEGKSGISEAYNAFVVEQTRRAVRSAMAAMQPAIARLATVHNSELDSFIHDDRPPEVHDSDVVVLNLTYTDGRPMATLVNWANHPETLGSKNTLITADYSANVYRTIEERLGGTAVFINGAVGGMQSPLGAKIEGMKDGSFDKADYIGRRVAEMAADTVRNTNPVNITALRWAEKTVRIPITNAGFQMAAKADLYRGRKPLNADGTTSTQVGLVRLLDGDTPLLDIALVPGELYPELSVGGITKYDGSDFPDAAVEPAIKRDILTAKHRMLFGLADDEIGYIIPKVEWDEKAPWLKGASKRWYGEVNSVGPDAAPMIAAGIKDLVAP